MVNSRYRVTTPQSPQKSLKDSRRPVWSFISPSRWADYSLAAAALYAAVLWLSVSFLGYGLSLREFARLPDSTLAKGQRHISGPITALSEFGLERGRHYRLRVQHSEEFAIPPQIAYPLWPGNPEPNRALSDFLHEGQIVTLVATGGPYPVVLELSLSAADGKQEKLLDAENSVSRYGAVQVAAAERANVYVGIGVMLLPLLFAVRVFWGKIRQKR